MWSSPAGSEAEWACRENGHRASILERLNITLPIEYVHFYVHYPSSAILEIYFPLLMFSLSEISSLVCTVLGIPYKLRSHKFATVIHVYGISFQLYTFLSNLRFLYISKYFVFRQPQGRQFLETRHRWKENIAKIRKHSRKM